MDTSAQDPNADLQTSLADARRRFLAAVKDIRPRLHRFCARMTGSALDGEDLVQETLAQAFYVLSSLKDASRLEPWLFRIAHNRCVDFLRREKHQQEDTVPYEDDLLPTPSDDDALDGQPVDEALARLVATLPPMERACVLLKDVLDYRLAEIAGIVDSTLGGVKAALHRGRAKLARPRDPPPVVLRDERDLLDRYVDCFNRRDWDALRHLIQADARVELVGALEFDALDPDAPYFRNYERRPYEWRLSVAHVDGERVIVHWRREGDAWRPVSAVRVFWRDGKVARIRDYIHVGYLLDHTPVDE